MISRLRALLSMRQRTWEVQAMRLGGKQCHTDFYGLKVGRLEGLGFRVGLLNLSLIGFTRVLILVSTSIQGKYYAQAEHPLGVSQTHSDLQETKVVPFMTEPAITNTTDI